MTSSASSREPSIWSKHWYHKGRGHEGSRSIVERMFDSWLSFSNICPVASDIDDTVCQLNVLIQLIVIGGLFDLMYMSLVVVVKLQDVKS